MNKPEMKRILKGILKEIKDKDVSKELKAINDLQDACDELNCLAEKRKKTITEGKVKCGACGHYFKPDPKRQYVTKRIVNKPTYWDSGYGDDDRYADFEVLKIRIYADFEVKDLNENCPKCQNQVTIKLAWLENQIPGTEQDRYGHIYN